MLSYSISLLEGEKYVCLTPPCNFLNYTKPDIGPWNIWRSIYILLDCVAYFRFVCLVQCCIFNEHFVGLLVTLLSSLFSTVLLINSLLNNIVCSMQCECVCGFFFCFFFLTQYSMHKWVNKKRMRMTSHAHAHTQSVLSHIRKHTTRETQSTPIVPIYQRKDSTAASIHTMWHYQNEFVL